MRDNQIRNALLRERYNTYRLTHYKPSHQEIAKHTGIDYSYFLHWKNGRRDMGDVKLTALELFLDEQERPLIENTPT